MKTVLAVAVLFSGFWWFTPPPEVVASSATAAFVATPTSGHAPLSVHFDATGSTAEGVARPFHALRYVFDFDDAGSGNWSTDGASKNVELSPIAAHLFESPGTYEVSLKVTAPNGDTDTEIVSITVSANSGLYTSAVYCYSDTTDNPVDWTGCPAGATQVTGTNANTLLSGRVGANTAHYFRRGDDFAVTTSISGTGPMLFEAFGAGANPVFNADMATAATTIVTPGPDWKFGNIDISAVDGIAFRNLSASQHRILVYDSVVTGATDCFIVDAGAGRSNYVSAFELDCTVGNPGAGEWLWLTKGDYAAFMGITINAGSDTDPNGLLRTVGQSYSIVSHSVFDTGTAGGGIWSLRACSNSIITDCANDDPNEFNVYSDNLVRASNDIPIRTCTNNSCNGTGSGTNSNDSKDLLFERNFFAHATGAPAANTTNYFQLQSGDTTIRNNVFDLTGEQYGTTYHVSTEFQGDTQLHGDYRDNIHILNNTLYVHTANDWPTSFFYFCGDNQQAGATGHLCYGNYSRTPPGTVTFAFAGDYTSDGNVADAAFEFETAYAGAGSSEMDDFTITATSDALDSGHDYGGSDPTFVKDDVLGGCRPAGSGWDAGADERNALVCP